MFFSKSLFFSFNVSGCSGCRRSRSVQAFCNLESVGHIVQNCRKWKTFYLLLELGFVHLFSSIAHTYLELQNFAVLLTAALAFPACLVIFVNFAAICRNRRVDRSKLASISCGGIDHIMSVVWSSVLSQFGCVVTLRQAASCCKCSLCTKGSSRRYHGGLGVLHWCFYSVVLILVLCVTVSDVQGSAFWAAKKKKEKHGVTKRWRGGTKNFPL